MQPGPNRTSSELVRETRQQIEPLLIEALGALANAPNPAPLEFFSDLLTRLRTLSSELELLRLFLSFSTTAFQGFKISDAEAEAVDRLLGQCESIALTMTARDDHAH